MRTDYLVSSNASNKFDAGEGGGGMMDCGCVCVCTCMRGRMVMLLGYCSYIMLCHHCHVLADSIIQSFDHLFFVTWSFVSLGLGRRESTLCSKRLFAVAAWLLALRTLTISASPSQHSNLTTCTCILCKGKVG